MSNHTKYLFTLGACVVAMVATRGSVAAPLTIMDPADPRPHEVRALHNEISLANLVRGLNLTVDQLDQLAGLAARADEVRATHATELEPLLVEMDESYGDLKDHLLASEGEPPPDVVQRARRAHDTYQKLRLDLRRDMAALENEVRDVLDGGQAQIIEEFQPCLIPPGHLASPTRGGQPESPERLVELLDSVRQAPTTTYERQKARMLDKAVERLDRAKGPLTEEAIAAERARVAAIVEETRAMDDLTWAVEGAALAIRLKAPLDPVRIKPTVDRDLTRVGEFLLAPGAFEVLASVAAQRAR